MKLEIRYKKEFRNEGDLVSFLQTEVIEGAAYTYTDEDGKEIHRLGARVYVAQAETGAGVKDLGVFPTKGKAVECIERDEPSDETTYQVNAWIIPVAPDKTLMDSWREFLLGLWVAPDPVEHYDITP